MQKKKQKKPTKQKQIHWTSMQEKLYIIRTTQDLEHKMFKPKEN